MGFIYYEYIIYANNVMKYKFPKDIQNILEFHSMPNNWLRDTHKLRWQDFEDFFPLTSLPQKFIMQYRWHFGNSFLPFDYQRSLCMLSIKEFLGIGIWQMEFE